MQRLTALCAPLLLLAAACSGPDKTPPPDQGRVAAAEAVKALRKVEAATQVGVTREQYGQLLIDAKAASNEAARLLPDGELKTELAEAVDAYADGLELWGQQVVQAETPAGRKVVGKYGAEPKNITNAGPVVLTREPFQQLVWPVARQRLKRVAGLLGAAEGAK
jgi:hypothetical protein